MSEYQYYEFLALDKPLTSKQREELRPVLGRRGRQLIWQFRQSSSQIEMDFRIVGTVTERGPKFGHRRSQTTGSVR